MTNGHRTRGSQGNRSRRSASETPDAQQATGSLGATSTPMSETLFLILLALRAERHGYGVMQVVRDQTSGRIELGAGTVYTTLAKLDKAGWITPTTEIDRRKYYVITPAGNNALATEARRIADLYSYAKELL